MRVEGLGWRLVPVLDFFHLPSNISEFGTYPISHFMSFIEEKE
jgi:hypothetical protein